MGTHPIELTHSESCYLSDVLSHETVAPSRDVRAWPHLLLKVGAAFLETAEGARESITVGFTEDELWILREVCKTSAHVGSEQVGYNLLLRIYRGLQSLCSSDEVHSAVARLGEGKVDEPSKEDLRQRLEELAKEGGDAPADDDTDEDAASRGPHRGADDRAQV